MPTPDSDIPIFLQRLARHEVNSIVFDVAGSPGEFQMPAKDLYHDTVKTGLIKDGWTITDDPLRVQAGEKDLYIDLGARRLLAATKGDQKIAVEVKSFLGPSEVKDLQQALGQFILYHDLLAISDPERTLYLAVSLEVYREIFEEPIGMVLLENQRLRLIVFDPHQEVLLQWIH
jgi:hypothetical protein